MEDFYIRIAELNVRMESRYAPTRRYCSDYIVDATDAEIAAQTSDDEIDAELKLYDSPHGREYCESICLYRSIAEKLPLFDRFVFHGAAVMAAGKGYIFTAPSGTGKTTHVGLWLETFGDRVSVINGDKPIVRMHGGEAIVYSCPWAGKEGWKSNTFASLGGICLIHRGKENRIRRIDPSEYFDELMHQVYIPKNSEAMLKTLELMDALAKAVPFYLLECDISEEAARTSFEAMVNKE